MAFANAAGGTLIVGVEDRSRHVRGVPEPLDLEERLVNWISDRISPRIVPEVEILRWRRTQVLAVQVYPSAVQPAPSSARDRIAASTSAWARRTGGRMPTWSGSFGASLG